MGKLPPHKVRRRPPWFHPVPLRARADGWSELRQCAFLAELYLTGSVTASALRVGMSRKGAYALRARDGAQGFAFAWDAVLTPPGEGRLPPPRCDYWKVTNVALLARLESGFVRPLIYHGRMTAIRRKPDNSALFRLLGRSGMGKDAGRSSEALQ